MARSVDKAVDQVRALATKAFAHHELRQEAEGRWRCAAPGTGIYAFRVVLAPGAIIVYGDIGELILSMWPYYSATGGPDPKGDLVPWLRGCLRSPHSHVDYVLSKSPTARKVFDESKACAYLERLEAEDQRDLAERIMDEWDSSSTSRDEWARACFEAGDDDPPACEDWDPGAYWCIEALRWWIAKIDAVQQPAASAEVA